MEKMSICQEADMKIKWVHLKKKKKEGEVGGREKRRGKKTFPYWSHVPEFGEDEKTNNQNTQYVSRY